MPIRNGARFLPQALTSLYEQTLLDWELIAILDASTDGSEEILAGWGDPRLRVLRLAESTGIADALNRGLQVAKGEFVARLDSDDECFPDRLVTQVREMDQRRNLGLLGSSATTINQLGQTIGLRRVARGPHLKYWLIIRNQFIHTSVIIRRSILEKLGGYRPGLKTHEDYELWLRLSNMAEIDNIREPMVRYRLHSGQMTRTGLEMGPVSLLIRRNRAALCTRLGVPHPLCAACGLLWEMRQRRYTVRQVARSS
jgi:GT2 family glycosyltransferase